MTVQTTSDTPVLDLLASMTADSIEATGLDAQLTILVRFAALVAVDAPPASYLLNLAAGKDVGLNVEDARNVLTAIAPIVGTAKTVAALSKIARALGLAVELADEDEDDAD